MFLLCVWAIWPGTAWALESPGGTEIPPAWQEIIDDAPMTQAEFSALTLSDWAELFRGLVRDRLRGPLRLFARLCGILLLCAVGRGLGAQRASPELSELLDSVSALAVFAVCVPTLLGLTGVLRQAVEASRTYMLSFVPVFASVLTACGQGGGAAVYSGIFFSVTALIAETLCRVGLPLVRMLMAMTAADAAAGMPALRQVCAAVQKWIGWTFALFSTVFGALMTLQSVFAQSADTLALRTGKFFVSSSVPVVGSAVSDAMGSVLAGMKLLKGTVGFAAIAAVMASFAPVILSCFLIHAVLMLGGIAAGALGGGRSTRLLMGLSDCVRLYIAMAFFHALLLTVGTLLMILLGNGG